MSENPTDLTAELVRLREAATPGTWYAHDVDDAMFMSAYLVTTNPVDPDPINESNEAWSREVVCATLFQQFRVASHDACRWEHDAHFIAFAANNARAIAAESAAAMDEIAALKSEIERLKKELADCAEAGDKAKVEAIEARHRLNAIDRILDPHCAMLACTEEIARRTMAAVESGKREIAGLVERIDELRRDRGELSAKLSAARAALGAV